MTTPDEPTVRELAQMTDEERHAAAAPYLDGVFAALRDKRASEGVPRSGVASLAASRTGQPDMAPRYPAAGMFRGSLLLSAPAGQTQPFDLRWRGSHRRCRPGRSGRIRGLSLVPGTIQVTLQALASGNPDEHRCENWSSLVTLPPAQACARGADSDRGHHRRPCGG